MYKRFCDVCKNPILDENLVIAAQILPPKGEDYTDFYNNTDFCGFACVLEWAGKGGKTS